MRFAIFLLAFSAAQASAESFDFQHSADNPEVMAALRDLALNGTYQVGDVEVAAFLVRDDSGRISCLLWPRNASVRSARYDGTLPDGIVARRTRIRRRFM